jgi:hypothetical protein
MTDDSRTSLRRLAERVLDDYVAHICRQSGDGAVGRRQLAAAQQSFLASPGFAAFLDQAHGQLMDLAADEVLRNERTDAFHRLMAHPLTDAFDCGALSRDILPNYFSFIRLVLGDAQEDMSELCRRICNDLQAPGNPRFTWDAFYADARAKRVLWAALVRIAESFRRFDVRRDWFIAFMQNRPQAVSLAPNAFLPRHSSEDPKPFGAEEFNTLFGDLFGPLRRLPPADLAVFRQDFGGAPEQVLGRLFAALTAIGAAV